ncbi:arginine succinyltransferase [Rhodothalassium salexigens DSM 2132]|uniref:Arginine succinyltransferase n=1 Tax=Rhodothalassium salexigens DSM 2132 TaxID=1188247 RepID=A0A4R2PIH6_RHOSA|nr:arginine N-succinyltransferase [Rhodothalassium salexigens]MBB4211352.1 arginine N-succinyltransferase [Rhodothalassium salexigens DSM 2132]MBK1637686.1 hypothetical protein [Rhodothalassium salexigens DSM 2132]TCP35273.1 arginine succinyltransferase [Rhodothalassium salexigens DSM 2132]
MKLLRPVVAADLDALVRLAGQTGGGMTSFPPDAAILSERIARSEASFARDHPYPTDDYFLFVLEDPTGQVNDGGVVGTAGIFAAVGMAEPFYSYRLLHLTQVSREPAKTVHTQLLQLTNDYAGITEVGTLFLAEGARAGGAGAFLSKSRFLMIAAHPERFADKVFAEIRGWVDEHGHSPFWDAVGRHFFGGIDFREADQINSRGNQQFIADLMPKFPIYTALLPAEAQAVIGRPHDHAAPAKRLLEREGFQVAKAVDIFDAGPCLEAPVTSIATIRAVRTASWTEHPAPPPHPLSDKGPEGRIMVANTDLERCRIALLDRPMPDPGDKLALTAAEARALALEAGDVLTIAPFKA